MDLLRFTTAGSVDDGKSTLIGRLLYDTKSIFEDQLEAVAGASRRLGEDRMNLALLTDGLRAEREQKITIDVAYRYFATPRRKFIIADTPGHVQYTRNMITGASTADLAVVLVDASRGVQTQSRRHAFITSLLGIPHMVVAVNKMDLVSFAESVYDEIVRDFGAFAAKLTVKDITYIPLSALEGDNVVEPSTRMPWYRGGPLLTTLETVTGNARRNAIDFRFPVQCVIRPHQDFRGFAGTAVSVSAGDDVVVLPSGLTTRIKSVETLDGPQPMAAAGDAVVLTTTEEIDISRGDMIVRRKNLPTVARRVDAYLCWMAATPLVPGRPYILAHTTRRVQAVIDLVEYRVNVDTLHRDAAQTLSMNEIGRVEITTADPIFFDSYRLNSATGSFILIDPATNATVAAGMIRGETQADTQVSAGVTWEGWNIAREERESQQGHRAAVVWLTGMSGAGKTTIARAVERRLFDAGRRTMLLDGDHLRHGLCGDLGFSPADRAENIRRAGEVARLFFEQGAIVLCAFVSPYAADRARVRALVPAGRFVEVFVEVDVETCRARDPKGLYARVAEGRIDQFTGVTAPYEAPSAPELTIDTRVISADAAADMIIAFLRQPTH
ncbi:MAG: sulfate adenylyltransferase subunit CysN [Acidobacteria bacterium]|nr:sulfate adenylyltransferase subunit CysN [Acidobacteriota bacterium]